MSDPEVAPPEPTSPRNVAADALVSIIMLAGAFVAETIKASIPQGVPVAVTLILLVSELTMIVYFLVVLVRAVSYAVKEFDKARASVEGTRTWHGGASRLKSLLSFLRRSLPTSSDFAKALRFGVRFVAVMAVVGVALLLVINPPLGSNSDIDTALDMTPRGEGGPKSPAENSRPPVEHSLLPDQPGARTEEKQEIASGARRSSGQSATAAPLSEKEPQGAGRAKGPELSRADILKRLKDIDAKLEELTRERARLTQLLAKQNPGSDAKRGPDRETVVGGGRLVPEKGGRMPRSGSRALEGRKLQEEEYGARVKEPIPSEDRGEILSHLNGEPHPTTMSGGPRPVLASVVFELLGGLRNLLLALAVLGTLVTAVTLPVLYLFKKWRGRAEV